MNQLGTWQVELPNKGTLVTLRRNAATIVRYVGCALLVLRVCAVRCPLSALSAVPVFSRFMITVQYIQKCVIAPYADK